jgi:acetyl-CoA carboxylase carboxyltransferase component
MAGGKLSDVIIAWPTADISFMAADVAINAAFGRNFSDAPGAEDMKTAFMKEMIRKAEPWEAAGLNLIDKVIDPRDTRTELIKALALARGSNGERGMSRRLLASWPKMV